MCVCTSRFQEITLSELLRENETIEDLQLNGLRLIQKKNAFRFGMDSVLLAHFADIRPDDTVADLGTGNGALIFLLSGRGKGRRYFALDIQKEAAELAARNALINQMEDMIVPNIRYVYVNNVVNSTIKAGTNIINNIVENRE